MVGLIALSLPPIVHAIFRFVDNTEINRTISLLKDLNVLYLNMEAVSWQIFAGYFKCPNTVFCETFEKGVHNFEDAIDTVNFISLIIVGRGIYRCSYLNARLSSSY